MANRAPEGGAQILDWAKTKGPKKTGTGSIADGAWAKARREVVEMMAGGDWEPAQPRHFAALYELFHERVYGVLPAELTPRARSLTALWASQLLQREFGGDRGAFAAYMRWAWQREVKREHFRRANGGEGGRVGPRLMFGGTLVTDHRVALARQAKT